MPEIGEVARIVHYLKRHCVGRTIAKVTAEDDPIVYGKVGTSADAFKKAMTGKRILDARQQGKYFWLVMSSPPHPLMHFGMTGWLKFSNDDTSYYKPAKPEEAAWPPRFLKFLLHLQGDPACEVAFVDPRRLGRIRLVDAEADMMRKTTPLKENGPDPVIDKHVLTRAWLTAKMKSKKVPVKALLLDQANISGVGNWVADEVLYQARIHPEQYSNTFSDDQLNMLHDKLIEVCTTACELLAESDKFPENWLMKHRWNKGKKEANRLPNGEKIVHLKVGGRTSAVVPSVQKKTGAVAGDTIIEDEEDEEGVTDEDEKPKKGRERKGNVESNGVNADLAHEAKKPAKASKKSSVKMAEANGQLETEQHQRVDEPAIKSRKRKTAATDGAKHEDSIKTSKKAKKLPETSEPTRRRSGRLSKG